MPWVLCQHCLAAQAITRFANAALCLDCYHVERQRVTRLRPATRSGRRRAPPAR